MRLRHSLFLLPRPRKRRVPGRRGKLRTHGREFLKPQVPLEMGSSPRLLPTTSLKCVAPFRLHLVASPRPGSSVRQESPISPPALCPADGSPRVQHLLPPFLSGSALPSTCHVPSSGLAFGWMKGAQDQASEFHKGVLQEALTPDGLRGQALPRTRHSPARQGAPARPVRERPQPAGLRPSTRALGEASVCGAEPS